MKSLRFKRFELKGNFKAEDVKSLEHLCNRFDYYIEAIENSGQAEKAKDKNRDIINEMRDKGIVEFINHEYKPMFSSEKQELKLEL